MTSVASNPEHSKRRMTIAANGQIVPKPYGPSRWASPAKRPCRHPGCPGVARILARADDHPLDGPDGPVARAHNCCGDHG